MYTFVRLLLSVQLCLGLGRLWAQDAYSKYGKPRIMVLISETIDDKPSKANSAEKQIEKFFLGKGFKVIDKTQMEAIKERDKATFIDDPGKAAALGARSPYNAAHVDLLAELDEQGVVGGILECHVAERHVAAVAQDDGVGAAHLLLALRVVHLVAVDRAGAGDGHVLHPVAEDERAVPLRRPRLGRALGRGVVLVVTQVRAPHEP